MNRLNTAHLSLEEVSFTINIGATHKECLISRDALNTLSQLKNIDSADADTLELFIAFETFIRPVALSLFKNMPLGSPLRLTPDSINTAYRQPMQARSAEIHNRPVPDAEKPVRLPWQ